MYIFTVEIEDFFINRDLSKVEVFINEDLYFEFNLSYDSGWYNVEFKSSELKYVSSRFKFINDKVFINYFDYENRLYREEERRYNDDKIYYHKIIDNEIITINIYEYNEFGKIDKIINDKIVREYIYDDEKKLVSIYHIGKDEQKKQVISRINNKTIIEPMYDYYIPSVKLVEKKIIENDSNIMIKGYYLNNQLIEENTFTFNKDRLVLVLSNQFQSNQETLYKFHYK